MKANSSRWKQLNVQYFNNAIGGTEQSSRRRKEASPRELASMSNSPDSLSNFRMEPVGHNPLLTATDNMIIQKKAI